MQRVRQEHPCFQRRDALVDQVLEIDRREHPQLNAQARIAQPFFRVWLYEALCQGEVLLDLSEQKKLAEAYAQAWVEGWRPRSKQEA